MARARLAAPARLLAVALLLLFIWWVALTAGGLALLALFQPAREEVRLGQAYALLLLGEVALLWAYLARRERTAGLLLGLLLGVKTAGLLLPALLLARRRWRALGWTLL